MPYSCKVRFSRLTAAVAVCIAGLAATSADAQVRISQAYGGGGLVTHAPNADYVELYNAGASAVDMTGWAVQLASTTGTSWQVLSLPAGATIQPGGYYLIKTETGSLLTGWAYTPDASFTTGNNLASTGGKVALTNDSTPLAALTCGSLPASIQDLVGFGATLTSGNETPTCPFATAGAAPATTSSTAVFRQCGGQRDVNGNASDFRTGVPAPRNSTFVNAATNRHVFSATNSSASLPVVSPGATLSLSATPSNSTATVPGCAAGSVASVVVDVSALGGTTVSLTGTGFAAWTGSFPIPSNAPVGVFSLPVTWTDDLGSTGRGNIVVNVPPGPPPNDTCATATEITAVPFTSPLTNMFLATADLDVTCNTTTATGTTNGVWFTFTPAANTNFLLNNTTGPDTVTTIFTGGCGALSEVACSDPSSFTFSNAVGGTTYHILVGRFAATAATTNPTNLVFTLNTVVLGACCNNTTGVCTTTTSAACSTITSTFQGDNTVCSPSPCPAQGSCCNPSTGACSITVETACASPSIWTAGPTTCTPTNPCPQPPPPANDLCASASVAVVGANVGTAAASTNDGTSSCQSSAGVDVWWSFTPAASGVFAMETCTGTPDWDTLISVHTGCPGTTANQIAGACADQGCSPSNLSRLSSVSLNGGTPVVIRVAGWSTFVVGNAYILNIQALASGACCNNTTGLCTVTLPTGCSTTTSTYQGDNTVCSPSPCPPPGSCCNPITGTCTITVQSLCASTSVWTAGVTSCTPNPCPPAPLPTNEECASAQTITGTGLFTFTNIQATTTAVNTDLPGCLGSTVPMVMNNDVWYRWVAPATGVFSHILRSAADGVVAPSVRSAIYDGGPAAGACPPSGSAPIACSTVPGLVAASVVAGNVYFIQVASTTAGSTGSGRMEFNFVAAATGSCCVGSACTVTSQAQCAAQSGSYAGNGTLCAPATAAVNSYTGTGGTIPDFTTPNPGVFTSSITVSDSFAVAGVEVDVTLAHTWVGDVIMTLSNGSRTISLTNRAKRGVLFGTATTPSIAGSSSNIGTGLSTGTSLYTFSDSGTTDFFAASTDSTNFNLPSGVYRPSTSSGISERFTDVFNGQPAAGTWTLTISDNAGIDTGSLTGWTLRLTQGTAPNCAPTSIVCCRGVTCAVIAADLCTAPAGVGVRPVTGTTCDGQSAINAGCCYADFNKSNVKDVADIFAFLSAWFADSPFSDVGGNGTGTRDVSDIFQFLSAWFAGCT